MQTALLIVTFILAVTDWIAAERGWKRTHYFAKPATLLALIAWFSFSAGWEGARLWFGLGLIFSLAGDIALLFPGRMFLAGVAAFALAHISYIVGFNQESFPNSLWWLVFLAFILLIDLRLFPRYIASPEGHKMALPNAFYSLVISLMVFSAMLGLLRPQWSLTGVIAALLGAWLFFISDNLLAYNRFVKPTPHSEFLVMSTYHLGQIAIIAGVILI